MHDELLRRVDELEAAEESDTDADTSRIRYPQRPKRARGGPPQAKNPERNRLVVRTSP